MRVLPGLVVLSLVAGALLATGTPGLALLRYAGTWAAAIVLPGTLIFRAVRGSRGNLPEDLGYGSATGLLLQLAAWLLGAATGWRPVLWLVPLLVVGMFVAVPRLRRHFQVRGLAPVPVGWAWTVAGVIGMALFWAWAQWRSTPLPGGASEYYPDLLYHLGLVRELGRTLPFQVPQFVGDTLHYHYLSDAHMAASGLAAGVPAATVLLRLWLAPILVVSVLVMAALGRQLTGQWWAGPAAAAAGLIAMPFAFGGYGLTGVSPLSYLSPSLTFLLPLVIPLVALVVDVLRGNPVTWGVWLLLAAFAFACTGAKATGVPTVLVGAGFGAVAVWVVSRRVPWRAIALLGLLGAIMAGGALVFTGGGAGGLSLELLSLVRLLAAYRATVGVGENPVVGGLLPPALADGASAKEWLFVLALVAWWLLQQGLRLVGLVWLPFARGTLRLPSTDGAVTEVPVRRDPAMWVLAGVTVAGLAAAWLVWNPSAGQGYFWLTGAPFGAVLSVALVAAAAHRADVDHGEVGRRWGWAVAGAVLTGAAVAVGLKVTFTDLVGRKVHPYETWALALGLPWAVAGVLAAVGILVWWAVARRRARTPAGWSGRGRGVVVAFAVALGATLAAQVVTVAPRFLRPSQAAVSPKGELRPDALTAAEVRAAAWLDANADRDDVVATNVHCRPIPTVDHCAASAFWVTGLGGRRAVIESWAYTTQAMTAHGVDGYPYTRQPAPDPQRYALNERVFSAGSATDVAALTERYGVRWLVADSRAGPVSPALADVATVRFTDGTVTIYEVV